MGTILDHFVCSLGCVPQWEPILAIIMVSGGARGGGGGVENEKRQGFAYLFAQYVLGALDFAEDPSSRQFLGVPFGEAMSSFTAGFFKRRNPDSAS